MKESRVQVGLRAANVQAKIRAVAMGLPFSPAAAAAAVDAVSGQVPLPAHADVETAPLAAAPLSAASGQVPLPAHADVETAPLAAAPLSADVVVAGGTRRKKTHKWAETEVRFVRQWLLDGKSGDWVACLKAGQSVLHPNRTTIAVKDCARTLRNGGYKKSFGIEL